ncbi:Uncharacterised protein [Chlamydia abortus]|nr:Uncharacterised protein [Chlamydia abortus]
MLVPRVKLSIKFKANACLFNFNSFVVLGKTNVLILFFQNAFESISDKFLQLVKSNSSI